MSYGFHINTNEYPEIIDPDEIISSEVDCNKYRPLQYVGGYLLYCFPNPACSPGHYCFPSPFPL